jgi:hypothetical protein
MLGLIEVEDLKGIRGKEEKNEDIKSGCWACCCGFCWSCLGFCKRGDQGNVYQLGGTVIIDKQRGILFKHVDQSGYDTITSQ